MTAGQGDQQGQQGQPDEQQGGQPPTAPPPWPPAGPPPGQPPYGAPGYGPPPAGQPPYGAPGYGPPNPYGAPPPYPQNPYSYPAAPSGGSGWGAEAPTPMDRPVTVRAGLGAFLAALVLGVVANVAMLSRFDEVLDYMRSQGGGALDDPGLEGVDADRFAELVLQFSLVAGIVVVALQLLFLWFAWRGHNWARIILWILGGLSLVSALAGAGQGAGPVPFATALGWFQTVLILVGVVLLAMKPSNDWYRFRKWQRATGRR
ncbi:hypothetical protein DQ237_05605 [Blastococcus sp. TF02-8]|uniref:hypothetical protein n=1 Tax=Blastococcus sp. TF02-8 TaxID=2250574 RepID=UPI000DE98C6C|nr:hypothetical protein [Blastococcus sp. TF02-8]RBY97067.1 hypothetical protein DQ237_05605 [Blastococcus sp. TF02-8]